MLKSLYNFSLQISANGLESLSDISSGTLFYMVFLWAFLIICICILIVCALPLISSCPGRLSPSLLPSAGISSVQCIPAPLATPIPVSDDSPSPTKGSTVPQDSPESPNQGTPRVPFSVPVSEHLAQCEVIGGEIDGLLDCIPKGAELSGVSDYNK